MVNGFEEDLLQDFVKIYILESSRQERIYPKEIIKELKEIKCNIKLGMLHTLFHKLHQRGYLDVETSFIKGKIRKYYLITKKGKKALEFAKRRYQDLMGLIV
jgi:PadR family transcriptional regulator, regulatory protein PadR